MAEKTTFLYTADEIPWLLREVQEEIAKQLGVTVVPTEGKPGGEFEFEFSIPYELLVDITGFALHRAWAKVHIVRIPDPKRWSYAPAWVLYNSDEGTTTYLDRKGKSSVRKVIGALRKEIKKL